MQLKTKIKEVEQWLYQGKHLSHAIALMDQMQKVEFCSSYCIRFMILVVFKLLHFQIRQCSIKFCFILL